jgi:hypothetical protein
MAAENPYGTIAEVVRDFMRNGKVADSTSDVLGTILKDDGAAGLPRPTITGPKRGSAP